MFQHQFGKKKQYIEENENLLANTDDTETVLIISFLVFRQTYK